jgi:radical SAM protein with 4Fe4S-binding SPASM domain
MEVATFERLMNEIREMDVKSLKLYFFGEPLMHPEIGAMCKMASTAAERVELTTNLIPWTAKKLEEIASSGIHYIRVSWYGEQAERVKKGLGVLRHYSRLYPNPPHVCLKLHSQSQMEEVGELISLVDSVTVEQLHTIGSDFVHLKSYEENKKACPYPFYTLVVKANGDVVPCCVAWDTSLVVGNIHDEPLLNIWRGERFEHVRQLHLEGRRGELAACAKCDTIFNCPDSVDSVSGEEYKERCEGK